MPKQKPKVPFANGKIARSNNPKANPLGFERNSEAKAFVEMTRLRLTGFGSNVDVIRMKRKQHKRETDAAKLLQLRANGKTTEAQRLGKKMRYRRLKFLEIIDLIESSRRRRKDPVTILLDLGITAKQLKQKVKKYQGWYGDPSTFLIEKTGVSVEGALRLGFSEREIMKAGIEAKRKKADLQREITTAKRKLQKA